MAKRLAQHQVDIRQAFMELTMIVKEQRIDDGAKRTLLSLIALRERYELERLSIESQYT